jgi:lysophospholipase L1-like esterase
MMNFKFCLLAIVCALVVGQSASAWQDDQVAALSPAPQDGDWWSNRHQEKLEALKKQDKVDLLMIGDSITHGWENDEVKAIWDAHYARRNAFNIGYSGDRTENVLWRLDHDEIKGISPKLITIMIGTNNTGHRQDKPEDTAAGIKQIITVLREQLPESKILLLAIFPRGESKEDGLRKINDATNEIIKELADGEHVHFLDINDKFLDKDGKLPKDVMPDLLHPNVKGYEIWAEAVEPTIARLMAE